MRIKKAFCFIMLFILLISPFVVEAHGGRTDGNGGHYDRSTGEYHYHHGYRAHQHENGVCPYDFDDKTGENGGSNNSGSSNDKNSINKDNNSNTNNKKLPHESKVKTFFVRFIVAIPLVLINYFIVLNCFILDHKNKDRNKKILITSIVISSLFWLLICFWGFWMEFFMIAFLPQLFSMAHIENRINRFRNDLNKEIKEKANDVYYTPKGKKYHLEPDCSAIRNAKSKCTRKKEYEVNTSMRPCSICWKDRVSYFSLKEKCDRITNLEIFNILKKEKALHPMAIWIHKNYWGVSPAVLGILIILILCIR